MKRFSSIIQSSMDQPQLNVTKRMKVDLAWTKLMDILS